MRTNEEQARLEREIQEQRQHISEIVQALEHKLSPGQMFERVLHSGKDAGGEFARNLGETVKANPVPSVLTAAGLLWLYAGKDKSAQSVRVTHGDTTQAGSDAGIGQRFSGKLGEVRHRAGDTAHDARQAIAQRAHQARDGMRHMLDDNPLAVGAMAVAAGALLGAMLPRTEAENRLMGEASDEATRKAKELRDRTLDEAERADRQATRQAAARPSVGDQPPGGFTRDQHDEGDEMSSGDYRGSGIGPGVGQSTPRPGASPNPY